MVICSRMLHLSIRLFPCQPGKALHCITDTVTVHLWPCRLCSSTGPQCSPSAICGVQTFLTQLPVNHLWDAAIPHGAVSTFCQLLTPLFVIFNNFSWHVLWFPSSCSISLLSQRPGHLSTALTQGTKARRQSRRQSRETTPQHQWFPQVLTECRNTTAWGGDCSTPSKGKASLGLTSSSPWAERRSCLCLASSILYHPSIRQNIKLDQEGEPRSPCLQLCVLQCPAAANSLLPPPSRTSPVSQQWVAVSLRLLWGGEGRVEPQSFGLLQSSRTTLTLGFSNAYILSSVIPVLLVIHVQGSAFLWNLNAQWLRKVRGQYIPLSQLYAGLG